MKKEKINLTLHKRENINSQQKMRQKRQKPSPPLLADQEKHFHDRTFSPRAFPTGNVILAARLNQEG